MVLVIAHNDFVPDRKRAAPRAVGGTVSAATVHGLHAAGPRSGRAPERRPQPVQWGVGVESAANGQLGGARLVLEVRTAVVRTRGPRTRLPRRASCTSVRCRCRQQGLSHSHHFRAALHELGLQMLYPALHVSQARVRAQTAQSIHPVIPEHCNNIASLLWPTTALILYSRSSWQAH